MVPTRSRDCDCPPAWAQVAIVVGSVTIAFSLLALCGLGVVAQLLG
jgi:hypothetical protein